MMKMKWLLLCLVFPVLSVKAQDQAWNDLKQICGKYGSTINMHYDAYLKMYTAATPVKMIDQLHAVCLMDQVNYYTQVGTVELIKNDHCAVTIDHDEKLVVVAAAVSGEKEKLQSVVMDMSKLLETIKQGGTRMQKVMRGNETWLEISELPDEQMLGCNIQYDPNSFMVKRVWLKVIDPDQSATDPVVVDITYKYDGKAATADHFNEKKFVRVDGKSAELQPAYQHYTLINQL
jgi:hypothetical protein